jgi:hypothetical protein
MMRWRLTMATALAAMMTLPTGAAAQSLMEKLLRVSGLTASPTQLRSQGGELDAGDIWVVALGQRGPRAVTTDGGYRSPVFSPAGDIYALKGDALVRLPAQGGAAVALHTLPGVVKLVGFDRNSADEVVVLLDATARSPLAVVSLRNGAMTPLPSDANSSDEQRILTQIRGQDRVYGDVRVYPETESKRGLARNVEWTDVYLRRGNATPQNVSACDGVNCSQPALSGDGQSVAFVKASGR